MSEHDTDYSALSRLMAGDYSDDDTDITAFAYSPGFDDCPDVTEEPLCPNCCSPWKCNGPHLVEGSEVVLFGKPGTVRWVLPTGKGIAVVFEGGVMLWAYGDDIGKIEDRE